MPSVTGLWPVAGWLEREVFDMYGVPFSGNPDLRRILTDYGFEGYPLRKDFPLTGYVELRYSEAEKRVVYEPVRCRRTSARFDFLMPWEGAGIPASRRREGDRRGGRRAFACAGAQRAVSREPEDTGRDAEDHRHAGSDGRREAGRRQATKEARKPRAAKAAEEVSKPEARPDPKPKACRSAA